LNANKSRKNKCSQINRTMTAVAPLLPPRSCVQCDKKSRAYTTFCICCEDKICVKCASIPKDERSNCPILELTKCCNTTICENCTIKNICKGGCKKVGCELCVPYECEECNIKLCDACAMLCGNCQCAMCSKHNSRTYKEKGQVCKDCLELLKDEYKSDRRRLAKRKLEDAMASLKSGNPELVDVFEKAKMFIESDDDE